MFKYLKVVAVGVLLFFLLTSMHSVSVLAAQGTESDDDFDSARKRWSFYLLGGNFDLNDPEIADKVTATAVKASGYWAELNKETNKTYLWADLDKGEHYGPHMTGSYGRLKVMTLAYSMKGSTLYGDEALLNDIIKSLDWLYENWFNEHETEEGNWWEWEIGTPGHLRNISTILYDKLSQDQIKNYMAGVRKFVADPGMMNYNSSYSGTGYPSAAANRVDLCLNAIMEGVLIKDSERIEEAVATLNAVFPYVTSSDGYYKDGSYVDHGIIPYTHSYGSVLINGVSEIIYLIGQSPWKSNDPEVNNVYQWVYDSYQPTIYKMQAIDSLRGRAITRETLTDLVMGKELLGSIALLAEAADEEDRDYFRSFIKYMILENEQYEDVDANIFRRSILKEIKEDSTVIPAEEYIAHNEFNNMDRSVHFGQGYGFVVSKSSKRIGRFELINGENQKGWYTGDGMTYLYNKDATSYSGDFWATVDYYRLPGTTVDTRARTTGSYQYGDGEGVSANTWSGGTTISNKYGVSGMELVGYESSLRATKSWFMFDDEIVALGAGISSSDNRKIETTIEQRKLNEVGDNAFSVNGVQKSNTLDTNEVLNNADWAHLKGNTSQGSDIGYYFPENSTVKMKRASQSGSWYDVNENQGSSTDTRTEHYLTMWFDHGKNPSDSTYSYVLLPNKSANEVESYAHNPHIEIIENSKEAQGVKENQLNMIAVNFFEDKVKTVDILTSNKKASIIAKEIVNDQIEVVVSDPTMENQGTIVVEVARTATGGVLKYDEEITVLQTSPVIRFAIDVSDARGKGFSATFNIDPEAEPAPLKWQSSHDFTAQYSLGEANVGIVTLEYDVTPLEAGIDGVLGISSKEASISAYKDLAMILRMYTNGKFEARNGSGYEAVEELFYESGVTYHVEMIANLWNQTYDARVTVDGINYVQIAKNYNFRTDAPETIDLGSMTLKDNGTAGHQFTVSNVVVSGLPLSSVELEPLEDSYIRDGAFSQLNYGQKDFLVIKSDSEGYNRKAFMKFSLDEMGNKNIVHGELSCDFVAGADIVRTIKVYEVNSEWDQDILTWENAPVNGNYIGEITIQESGIKKLNMTEYLSEHKEQDFLSLVFVNEGAANSDNYVSISSKESDNGPTLTIMYE